VQNTDEASPATVGFGPLRALDCKGGTAALNSVTRSGCERSPRWSASTLSRAVGAASTPRWGVFQKHHPWRAPGCGVQALWLPSKVVVPCVAATTPGMEEVEPRLEQRLRKPLPQWEQGWLRYGPNHLPRRLRSWSVSSWKPTSGSLATTRHSSRSRGLRP